MNTYRLHYLADSDDANWKKCGTTIPVEIGDTLKLSCDYYHVVCEITQQKTGVRLDLSNSCQSADEAWLVAEQYGHYPKPNRPKSSNPQLKVHEGDEIVQL